MQVIGLTGGIASGKSAVTDAFSALGVPIVDADLLAREVVTAGSVGLQRLVDRFGKTILDGEQALDRAALRQRIFNDNEARHAVEGILHPLIRQAADQQLNAHAEAGAGYAIHCIPLLVETAQTERFDRIVVVDVPASVQLERLMARDGISREAAEKILSAQASREERLAIADDVIDNTGTLEALKLRVRELHEVYRQL